MSQRQREWKRESSGRDTKESTHSALCVHVHVRAVIKKQRTDEASALGADYITNLAMQVCVKSASVLF